MPAPKSIANHEAVEYSGFESSGPSLIFPYLLKAIANTNTTNASIASRYSQANLTVRKLNTAPEATVKLALPSTAQRAIPPTNMSEPINTTFLLFFSIISAPFLQESDRKYSLFCYIGSQT